MLGGEGPRTAEAGVWNAEGSRLRIGPKWHSNPPSFNVSASTQFHFGVPPVPAATMTQPWSENLKRILPEQSLQAGAEYSAQKVSPVCVAAPATVDEAVQLVNFAKT